MALGHATHFGHVTPRLELLWIAVVAVAIIGLMLVLTWILGFNAAGPAFELTPDPAGGFLTF